MGAPNLDSLCLYGAGAALPLAAPELRKAVGIAEGRWVGVEKLDVARHVRETMGGIKVLEGWAQVGTRAVCLADTESSASGAEALRQLPPGIDGGDGGGGEGGGSGRLFMLFNSCSRLLGLKEAAKSWKAEIRAGDALVLLEEERFAFEEWGLYMTAALGTRGFVVKSFHQGVQLGLGTYTVAVLRCRTSPIESRNLQLLPPPKNSFEPIAAELQRQRNSRWVSILYRLGGYGLEPYPRHEKSSRPPPVALPPPTPEQLALLPPKSRDAEGNWKYARMAYGGQTVAPRINNGGNPDAVLQRRGDKHAEPVLNGLPHDSYNAGCKLGDMVTMGVVDLRKRWANYEPIEVFDGDEDQPLYHTYGGAIGFMEAIGVLKKASGASPVIHKLRVTHNEQDVLTTYRLAGAMLNACPVACIPASTHECSEAGKLGVVQQGLLSAKRAATPAEARTGWCYQLQQFFFSAAAEEEDEAAGEEGEAAAAPEDSALVRAIEALKAFDTHDDMKNEGLRAALGAQAPFEAQRCFATKAAEFGLEGKECSFGFAGFNKRTVADAVSAEQVMDGHHEAARKGQAGSVASQKAKPATLDGYGSAF